MLRNDEARAHDERRRVQVGHPVSFPFFFGGFFGGDQVADSPVGSAGSATFGYRAEVDATVTYQWRTEILAVQSGLEQRRSWLSKPRQRYAFSSVLTDVQQRQVLAQLAGVGHEAPDFLLALAHEQLPVQSSTSSAILLHSDTYCDWAEPGQRIVVVGRDGTVAQTWIVSVGASAFDVNDDVSAVAVDGALVMPAMQVKLDPEQALPRFQKAATRWDLVAWATRYRFGEAGEVGRGATVSEYDSMPVWDRGALVNGTRAESILTGVSLIDSGMGIGARQDMNRSNWRRPLAIESSKREPWQWLKLFLDTVRGRWKAFLLRTGRPDLIPIGDASTGTLTVDGSQQSYVTNWYPSTAHRRLAIVLEDGSVNYRTVESTGSAGATEDLVLDSPLAGTISRIEFLETCRLDSDDVEVRWNERGFRSEIPALVVQR
jgi:hypothetical protein